MDIRMPDMDGLSATRLICADPALAGTRVLVLTTFEIEEYVLEALRAGAGGFLGKGAEPDEVRAAIRTVAVATRCCHPAATGALIRRFLSRPPRRRRTRPDRADRPGARGRRAGRRRAGQRRDRRPAGGQPGDGEDAREPAMAKLGARSRAQLVVIAFQAGLGAPG
jgi:DNA-binding NarL/FixJ family response regulator